MRAAPFAYRTTAQKFSTDLNNLRGYRFGIRIAPIRAERIAG